MDFLDEIDLLSPNEEWKVIKNTNDKYYISNMARVYSLKVNRLLKPWSGVTNGGYYQVSIDYKYHMLHRLVAQTFIHNPNNYPIINHIDGDKANNRIDNLEWCTTSYNNSPENMTNYKSNLNGGNRKKPVRCVETGVIYKSLTDAAKSVNVGKTQIRRACYGIIQTSRGFHWEFVNIDDLNNT